MRILLLLAFVGIASALPQYFQPLKYTNVAQLKSLKKGDKVNAEELSGQFEGDIIFTPEIIRELQKRNGMRLPSAKWDSKVVAYTISDAFDDTQKAYIRRGLDTLELSTCIKFVPRTTEVDYVDVIGTDSGCWSWVGKQGGRQELNLQLFEIENGCMRLATIMHEFIHALGFYHMQSTYDRDDFVDIIWSNIQGGTENNFYKYESNVVTDYGVTYDYSSVMHYGPYGFAINPAEPTIVPKDPDAEIGQRVGLSRRDIEKLNLMYECPL